MTFTDLPLEAQNFLMSNHDYISKWFLFLVLIMFSCYYLFVKWKEQQPTIYFSVVIFRVVLFGLSFAYLVSSPLTILLMSPELSFQDFYSPHLTLYLVIVSIAGLVLMADVIRYGITGLFKKAGFDMGDPHAQEVANTFYNNKHFFKWSKRR